MAYDDTDSDKICKVGCTRTFKPTRQQSLWIENAAQRGHTYEPRTKELTDKQREQQRLFQKVSSFIGLPL